MKSIAETRALFSRPVARFLVESLFVAIIVVAVLMYWENQNAEVLLFGHYGFASPGMVSEYRGHPFWLLILDRVRILTFVIGTQLVLTLIFYGTSYTVTPFKLMRTLLIRLAGIKNVDVADSDYETDDGALGKEIDASKETIPRTVVNSSGQPLEADTSRDPVDRILVRLSHSAARLSSRMERRMNTYLILGIVIGAIGLAVWAYANQIPTAEHLETMSFMASLLFRTLPRITILIFVELLAGFFLRQYRIGVEDFKYFLQLERQAYTNRLVYALITAQKDEALKTKFFDTLVAQSLNKADDTAKIMELADNPSLEVIKTLGESANEIVKAMGAAANKLK